MYLDRSQQSLLRRAVRGRHAVFMRSLAPAPSELEMSAADIDEIVRWGAPFHMVAAGRQDERPHPRRLGRRLAAGETLYLVQPHEYLPRIRRFVHSLALQAGFLGRPARSFLFRVEVPGSEAMPMHDDGAADLVWFQLAGSRYAAFGEAALRRPGRMEPVVRADGRTVGWFRGSLPSGSLLYLPPHAPHHVRCKRPSLALSIYWEPADPVAEAADWLRFDASVAQASRSQITPRAVAAILERAAARAKGPAWNEWSALRRTADGGLDRPPAGKVDWEDPATAIVPWRAFETLRAPREALLVAGGDRIIGFPAAAAPALDLLAHYRTTTRDKLAAATTLSPAQVSALLVALEREGLVTSGELPATRGSVDPGELSGWEYSAD